MPLPFSHDCDMKSLLRFTEEKLQAGLVMYADAGEPEHADSTGVLYWECRYEPKTLKLTALLPVKFEPLTVQRAVTLVYWPTGRAARLKENVCVPPPRVPLNMDALLAVLCSHPIADQQGHVESVPVEIVQCEDRFEDRRRWQS